MAAPGFTADMLDSTSRVNTAPIYEYAPDPTNTRGYFMVRWPDPVIDPGNQPPLSVVADPALVFLTWDSPLPSVPVVQCQLIGVGHNDVRAPLGVSATPVAGGALPVGTYYYVVTSFVGAAQSLISAEVSATTSGGNLSVQISWSAVAGATSYRVYGRTQYGESMYWTVAAPTVTYTDTGTAGTAGIPPSNIGTFPILNGGAPNAPYTSATVVSDGGGATIDITSGFGFPRRGKIFIGTGLSVEVVTYTNVSHEQPLGVGLTRFTGCSRFQAGSTAAGPWPGGTVLMPGDPPVFPQQLPVQIMVLPSTIGAAISINGLSQTLNSDYIMGALVPFLPLRLYFAYFAIL